MIFYILIIYWLYDIYLNILNIYNKLIFHIIIIKVVILKLIKWKIIIKISIDTSLGNILNNAMIIIKDFPIITTN
jgi:hypothetical protein